MSDIGGISHFAEEADKNICLDGKGRQPNLLPAFSKTHASIVSMDTHPDHSIFLYSYTIYQMTG